MSYLLVGPLMYLLDGVYDKVNRMIYPENGPNSDRRPVRLPNCKCNNCERWFFSDGNAETDGDAETAHFCNNCKLKRSNIKFAGKR
jgi:hypothetical protein